MNVISLDIFPHPAWQAQIPDQVPATLQPQLCDTGSLTARLKATGRAFSLQLLTEVANPLPQALAKRWQQTDGIFRAVNLLLDNTAVIYAQTWIPASSWQALTPLAALKQQPLGEFMFAQPDLTRSAMQFITWSTPRLPGQTVEPIFGRRSFFCLQQHELLVQELFLHGDF